MSFDPSHDAKEQVRQAVDIVELVGRSLELRRQGNHFVAPCPWHDDQHPSLQVNPDRQSWRCWVCNIGGDVFSFVMQNEGVNFREALEILAEQANVPLRRSNQAPAKPGSPNDKSTLYEAVAWAESLFHEYLLKSQDAELARRYLEARGITQESLQRWHIGFAPNQFNWIADRARTTKFSPEVLLAAGLLRKSERQTYYDFFRGRVMFPIRDTQNRPIAFGGRILPEIARQIAQEKGDSPGKYFNSNETKIYSKSENFYGLNLARDAIRKEEDRVLVVVEGFTDVIIPHQAGVHNLIAVQGTALNDRHIRVLKRYCNTVVLVLDGDQAGQTRATQILEHFVAADMGLRVLTLPEGLDPCDFVARHGAEQFEKLIGTAVDALEHKVRVATAGVDVVNDTHAASRALEDILSTIAKAPKLQITVEESRRLREQQMLNRLARQFAIPEEQLRKRLANLRQNQRPSAQTSSETPPRPSSAAQLTAQECELLELLLRHPELAPQAMERISQDDLDSNPAKKIYSLYFNLDAVGEPLEFARVITELEDPQLKHMVVELDERSHRKSEAALQDAAARLNGLLQYYSHRQLAAESRQTLVAIEQKQSSGEESLDDLEQFIAQQRERQGISAPTEG